MRVVYRVGVINVCVFCLLVLEVVLVVVLEVVLVVVLEVVLVLVDAGVGGIVAVAHAVVH